MCGRYVIEWLPDEIHEVFQLRRFPEGMFRSYNAAPTQQLPVIVERVEGDRELVTMRWGLIPRWVKPGDTKTPAPFNARAETLAEKPMFRSLAAHKRCIVPANGYYEWKQVGGHKQPYLFEVADEPLFGIAGLYDEFKNPDGEPLRSYTIVTTAPNALAAEYHNRMPAILRREDHETWLSPEITEFAAIEHVLRAIPAEELTAHAVSTAVNNVRNDDPSLIEPIPDPAEE